MSKKKALVGFDRYVELPWMDEAARLVSEGKSLSEMNDLLDEFLLPWVDGDTSRRKTKNILTATWLKTSSQDTEFKSQAIDLFKHATPGERLAIHYGICIATYPYFLSLSKILGRLFKLQDEVTSAEFNRRVIESVGDRDSIKRAAARYLQSLVQWGLLVPAGKSSVKPGKKIQLHGTDLVTWLYSSLLFSADKAWMSIDDMTSDPAWFPFEIAHGYFDIDTSKIIEVVHRGVGSSLVALKT